MDGRTLRLIALLFVALTATACMPARLMPVAISGRVVVEGDGRPLANHEVELWTLRLPALPIGMGSYIKKTTVRTDQDGFFSLSTEIPRNRRFELRTSNPGTVFGGSTVNLEPASSFSDVTLVHKMHVGPKSRRPAMGVQ